MKVQFLGRALLIIGVSWAIGCSSSSDTATEDDGVTVQNGVDYSWARPSPTSLRKDGYTFAARYLASPASGKNISKGEADGLWAAGVDIVANWESWESASLNGYSQGVSDAKNAEAQALAAGMPANRPIYFSIDFDASSGQQGAINSYFDGVASVLGRDRTGAYGGYYVIQRLFNDGKIKWGWQTHAWSYGNWDSRAQLRQVQSEVTIAGGDCDIDHAVAADFGQWHYTPPAPPPPPVPPAGTPTVETVSWAQLSTFVPACDSSNAALTPECMSAYKRYCVSLPGNNTGFGPIEKSTTEASVVCLHTDVLQAAFSDWDTSITSCDGQTASGVTSSACASAVHRYCRSLGQATGFGPTEHLGDEATIACLDTAQAMVFQSTYTELETYQSSCNGTGERWGGECNAAINRLCHARGAVSGFGPVENSGNDVTVACVKPVVQ